MPSIGNPWGICLLALSLSLTACGESDWNGTIYPDREDLATARSLGTFTSLDACKSAADAAIDELRAAAGGSFAIGAPLPGWECGAECRTDADGDLLCRRVETGAPEVQQN